MTSGGGGLSIANSSLITILPSVSILLNGAFIQSGIGGASIGGQLTTNGNLISFSGPITLTGNFAVNSNGGGFIFTEMQGTSLEDLTVTAGSGAVSLGSISNSSTIGGVAVTGSSIELNGAISANSISLISDSSIFNGGTPFEVSSPNNVFFNALGGDVGSLLSPIYVNTLGTITAGAGEGYSLADFTGSSSDNTVHAYPSNPPCVIYFNGVKIKDCGAPPPPPPPGPTPSSSFSPYDLKGSSYFAVEGVYDSQFNLASDYYFYTYILNGKYLKKPISIFFKTDAEPVRSSLRFPPFLM